MNSAREEILRTIRFATGGASPTHSDEYAAIQRQYRRTGELDPNALGEYFIDRLHDYGSGIYRCAEREISQTVARVLEQHGKTSLLVSASAPPDWLPPSIVFVSDANLTYSAIDESEGVLTGCAVAIALTGTIVLRHTDERRALTLIPDYHLCIVFEEQIVETVPEAMAIMRACSRVPITTVSGPSATADIEMTRIKGVHGPRFMDVILASRGEGTYSPRTAK